MINKRRLIKFLYEESHINDKFYISLQITRTMCDGIDIVKRSR